MLAIYDSRRLACFLHDSVHGHRPLRFFAPLMTSYFGEDGREPNCKSFTSSRFLLNVKLFLSRRVVATAPLMI